MVESAVNKPLYDNEMYVTVNNVKHEMQEGYVNRQNCRHNVVCTVDHLQAPN